MRVTATLLGVIISVILSVGFGCDEAGGVEALEVTSLAFGEGEVIPDVHTCHGGGQSPPLTIYRVPEDAKELVLVLEDLDYITGPFTHWMLWGVAPDIIIPPDVKENPPEGAVLGTADDGKTIGYLAPCAPVGDDYHRFRFTVFATDEPIRLEAGSDRKAVDTALHGHVLGKGTLTGRVPPKDG